MYFLSVGVIELCGRILSELTFSISHLTVKEYVVVLLYSCLVSIYDNY